MTDPDAATSHVPSVGTWRRRARAARRGHQRRTLQDTLSDLYMGVVFAAIYGLPLYLEVDRHLRSGRELGGAVERHWLWIAALLAAGGLAWRGVRALGPVMAGPAEQHWVLASPMPRRALLRSRLVLVAGAGGSLGALAGFIAVLMGSPGATPWVWVASGGLGGLALAGAGVGAQASGDGNRAAPVDAVGALLLTAGGLLAGGVIAGHYAGLALPSPPPAAGPLVVLAGVPLAGAALWSAWAALPELDRARLGAGTQLAGTIVAAAVWLDVGVLWAVLEERRLRRVGRVRSRRLRGPVPLLRDRTWALLQAELIRAARRPGLVAIVAGLAVGQFAMAVAAPALAGVAKVVLAYVLAGRFMGGLRTIARSGALRRALGGPDWLLRLVHVAVPGVTTLLWWLLTAPADPAGPGVAALLAVGAVAAAYRASTRGPVAYDTAMLETPLGPLPIGLLLQLARGPDLLGALVATRVFLG